MKWKQGPIWLPFPSQWPTWQQSAILHAQVAEEELEDTQEEAPSVSSKPLGIHTVIDITRFSSLSKLLSVTAYVLRFVQNCRKSVTSQLLGPLTVPELTAANQKWLYNNTFAHEISNLQSGGSRLQLVRQLRLFLDKNGLLRCGGRIHNAPLSNSAKFPCLLPSRHHFTVLIIKNAHTTQLHSGVNATLTALLHRYWILITHQQLLGNVWYAGRLKANLMLFQTPLH